MKIHYYLVCSRFEALIASHLEPEAFGLYMAVGSKKLASGRVIFFEIDPAVRDARTPFRLEDIETRCAPHEDGSPKLSKYISVYRTMEFLPLDLYRRLYLVTADGRVLGLDGENYRPDSEEPGANLYQELCPLIPLVVSKLPPSAFLRTMTDPDNSVSAPRLFFGDLRLDRDEHGRLAPYLPYSDPAHIVACLNELEQEGRAKASKTISRTPRTQGFFRLIRRGFFIGDQAGQKFYRFPSQDELEIRHPAWWHSASAN